MSLSETELKELFQLTRSLGLGPFDKDKAQRFQDLFGEMTMNQRIEWNAITLELRGELIEEQKKYLKEHGLYE